MRGARRIGHRAHVLHVVDRVRQIQDNGTDKLRRDAHIDLGTRAESRGVARIPSEEVDEEVGHDGLPRVPAEPDPRGKVWADTHGRSAACLAIVKHSAELSYRAAYVHVPKIVELHVRVCVDRALGRQPVRRPILPPVEVPKTLLENRERFEPVERGPVIPGLLVGVEQEPEIVDFEPRRATLVACFELQESTGASEQELLRIAGEGRSGGIEGELVVRTLVVMHGAPLCAVDRGRAAADTAEVERSRELVATLVKAVPEIERADIGLAAQEIRRPLIGAAVHRGRHESDIAFAVPEVLLTADGGVVGQRLDGSVTGSGRALRDAIQGADRQSIGQAAREFCRAEDST